MDPSTFVIRPQSILVLLLLAAVVLWGAQSVSSGMQKEPTPSPETTMIASNSGTPTAAPAARPRREPTPRPTSTPEPEPTTTRESLAEERPSAPDTGLDGTSLIVERGDSGRREVAFTFDAGEGAGHTEAMLDILDEYGVKGSFGLTGEWVEQNPALARRIVEDGHMVINHTYDHRSWTGDSTGGEPLTAEERTFEVEQTERTIRDVTGYETAPYFRFPYGAYDEPSLELLNGLGYDYTLWWTCDTLGWDGETGAEITERCGPDAEDGGAGAIILMHVVTDGDLAALPLLLQEYTDARYEIVTMEQMIQP